MRPLFPESSDSHHDYFLPMKHWPIFSVSTRTNAELSLLIVPFEGDNLDVAQKGWSAAMESYRIEVERRFEAVVNTWPFLKVFWKFKGFPASIELYFTVAVLLTNARNYFHPSKTSRRLNYPPPSV